MSQMTYKQAAQEALQIQNGCNASGIVRSMHEAVGTLWAYASAFGFGTDWVNRHPVITMYLCKLSELNGASMSSLSPCYDSAEKACVRIVEGLPEPDYRRLDWDVDMEDLRSREQLRG